MLYKEEAFGFEEKTEVFSLLVSLFEEAIKQDPSNSLYLELNSKIKIAIERK